MPIGALCLLIAGIAVGFWLFGMMGAGPQHGWLPWVIGVLGGLAVVGPPVLLWDLYRKRRQRLRPWGPGELLWFTTGISAWLLWPPTIYQRVRPAQAKLGDSGAIAAACFLYGTPLMALYLTLALLFGGHLRRRGRRRSRLLSWRDRFGLALGGLWAATGLWVLYQIYGDRLK